MNWAAYEGVGCEGRGRGSVRVARSGVKGEAAYGVEGAVDDGVSAVRPGEEGEELVGVLVVQRDEARELGPVVVLGRLVELRAVAPEVQHPVLSH